MARKKRASGERSHGGAKVLIRIAVVLVIVACAVAFISSQNSIVEKRRELEQIEEEIDTLKVQNEELDALIRSDDISRYMEKLAVENNDYAYPDERRYYDTSHH